MCCLNFSPASTLDDFVLHFLYLHLRTVSAEHGRRCFPGGSGGTDMVERFREGPPDVQRGSFSLVNIRTALKKIIRDPRRSRRDDDELVTGGKKQPTSGNLRRLSSCQHQQDPQLAGQ